MESVLADLEGWTGQPVELGSYWITAGRHDASWSSRIRGAGPFPGLASHTWEAALLASASERRGLSAFLELFAFADGRRATPDEHFWSCHYTPGEAAPWRSQGWLAPDGAGEWDSVRRTGDCFDFLRLACGGPARVAVGAAMPVTVDLADYELGSTLDPTTADRSAGRVSIGGIRRVPEFASGPDLTRSFDLAPMAGAVRIDLRRWAVDWLPGEYEVVFRLHHLSREAGESASPLTTPYRFSIIGSTRRS
jgi:hypothetical protein